jgi:hypothetical protein
MCVREHLFTELMQIQIQAKPTDWLLLRTVTKESKLKIDTLRYRLTVLCPSNTVSLSDHHFHTLSCSGGGGRGGGGLPQKRGGGGSQVQMQAFHTPGKVSNIISGDTLTLARPLFYTVGTRN